MPFIQICLLLFLFHIKYGNNIQDIPNVSYTDTSTILTLSSKTNQYLREQLIRLTEQSSLLKLSSTDRIMREIYTQSLKTFIIEKRNLTELVHEMANYTNGAIMKKLIAIRNLVNISEQSYRRFAKTDEETRNATIKFMEKYGYLSSKHVKNVAINSTNENASLTTTATTTTTTVSSLSMITLDELSTETPYATNMNMNDISSNENISTPTEEDLEYIVLKKDLLIQQKKHFGGAFVNITHSTVHVPTIIYSLGKEILLTANWSYNLNQAFIDNYNHDPELTWQYFCSQTGLYRVWPGHKWEYPEDDTEKLDLFDCRVQNWYIRATSSPRDVIILIDASGSMTGLKKSIAIQTVETILDTLSDDDFVQIIKFQKCRIY
jgi:hypothetical protein